IGTVPRLRGFLTLGERVWHTAGNGPYGTGVNLRGVEGRRGELRTVGPEIFSTGFCDCAALRASGKRSGGHRPGSMVEGLSKAGQFPRGSAVRTLADAARGADLLRFSARPPAQPGVVLLGPNRAGRRLAGSICQPAGFGGGRFRRRPSAGCAGAGSAFAAGTAGDHAAGNRRSFGEGNRAADRLVGAAGKSARFSGPGRNEEGA